MRHIGRSGVELTEVRHGVRADGEQAKGKPSSAYHDGLRSPGATPGSGYSGAKMRSHGFGPSKIRVDESMPKLDSKQQDLLLKIDDKKADGLPKENPIALSLLKLDLIMWSDRDNVWKTMADGRRVAGLLRGE
jgi:hypothetical protein